MTIIDFDAKPSTLVDVLTETLYLDGLHDCCGLDEFNPDECPDCLGCGHCAERHQELAGASVGRGVCDAPGCACFHLSTGDDCELCSGTGTVADSNDNEYECIRCGGHGVVS